MPTALVTGITGQDGYYLSKLLLDKGYEVWGLIRGQNNPKRELIERDLPEVELIEGDLTDSSSLSHALNEANPDEVYNLGAISFVGLSFKQPELTANVTGLGCLRLLEACRQHLPTPKFYQASTSELFGLGVDVNSHGSLNETTRFHPRSPYGTAKAFAHYSTVNYREAYDMHASCGILFNHESVRRGPEFVTRKVTKAAARIALGLQSNLQLGNLSTYRDWGAAEDYVEAMWMMLQKDEPDDYVIATGVAHSITDLLKAAFSHFGLNWKDHVEIVDREHRPSDVAYLQGDPHKAEALLGWYPKKTFEELIKEMAIHDKEIAIHGISHT